MADPKEPDSEKTSDATSDRESKFTWTEADQIFIVSQPTPEEQEAAQKRFEELTKGKPQATVLDWNSPLGRKVRQQIDDNKKAGKYGVGKSPLDKSY
jgi:hypothetical protein